MDQQPGRRPTRQGQGRPPGRQSGSPDEFVGEPPNVVRPFVQQAEEGVGGRRPDGGDRMYGAGAAGGNGPGGAGGPGGPGGPGPISGLVPTPMPAPRAVARQIPPEERALVPAQRPMSDLTTTMPILAVPIEDGDGYNAPPGEHGHYHEDGDGRHRGGSRSRGLKAAAVLVGVVAAGVAVAGTFSGGSGKSATPQAAGATSAGAAPAQDPASTGAPSSTAAAVPTTPSQSATTSPTPSHSSKSPTPKPTTSASTKPSSPAMVSRPSSAASTPISAPSTPPPSTASSTPAPPPFTPLRRGDSGPAVSKLQADLIAAGYNYYDFQDGTFDRATYHAVVDFQMNHPGTGDADGYGTYGTATNKALQSALNGVSG